MFVLENGQSCQIRVTPPPSNKFSIVEKVSFLIKKGRMMSEHEKLPIIQQALEWCYTNAIEGRGFIKSAQDFAEEYLSSSNGNKEEAANSLIRWSAIKAGSSGFVTGFGGLLTLPVTIPTDVSATYFIQLRMIAAIAHMGGHDVCGDRVKTLCFLCLLGESAAGTFSKTIGKPVTAKLMTKMIEKVPGKVLIEINKAVGFRLITKAGSTGIINLTKMLPVAAALVGGGFNYSTSWGAGKAAKKIFITA